MLVVSTARFHNPTTSHRPNPNPTPPPDLIIPLLPAAQPTLRRQQQCSVRLHRVLALLADGQLRLEKKPRLVVGIVGGRVVLGLEHVRCGIRVAGVHVVRGEEVHLAGVDTAPSVIVRGLDGADAPADALPLVDNAAPLECRVTGVYGQRPRLSALL